MRNQILVGDVRAMLRSLPAESVHCAVTSPPYWGLRTYGVEGQLGLESTPEEYVANMVDVFAEVKRVLRKDGTVWCNLGDSYSADAGTDRQPTSLSGPDVPSGWSNRSQPERRTTGAGLPAKNLVGIPWRVAFALQADGWWLRSEIIWAKPNPMPESVTDRPTKAHEQIFLLTKAATYFYDAEAVREPVNGTAHARHAVGKDPSLSFKMEAPGQGNRNNPSFQSYMHDLPSEWGRNRRTVWEIATEPFEGAHFATFPQELVKPCILAGTSAHGVCSVCGAPWERVFEKETHFEGGSGRAGRTAGDVNAAGKWAGVQYGTNIKLGPVVETRTTGWRPTCKHEATLLPAIVLDPFMGSGTTGLVAKIAGRDFVGIDLNPEYARMAHERIGTNQERLL